MRQSDAYLQHPINPPSFSKSQVNSSLTPCPFNTKEYSSPNMLSIIKIPLPPFAIYPSTISQRVLPTMANVVISQRRHPSTHVGIHKSHPFDFPKCPTSPAPNYIKTKGRIVLSRWNSLAAPLNKKKTERE
jgi:hypothetical protein